MSNFDPDFFTGETSSEVHIFNLAAFFESNEKAGEEIYKYEDSVLRPRHIIKLTTIFNDIEKVISETESDHLFFSAKIPVVRIDGKTYVSKTLSASSFNELVDGLIDYINNGQEFHGFHSVHRYRAIDSANFDVGFKFKVRLFYPEGS